MSFREPHELHRRRFGRNLGVGLVLGAFVALVFGLTVVKVTNTDFGMAPVQQEAK
ncbi:hypothetical protein [Chachezhania sediminis]|uniref:hypothetical protein n=1 Tax=Chachezhania sediminis TaxID=2599291 RepID=UPI0018EEF6C1|nr:hypothetical protein [Chachezhania sediminis]